MPEKSSEQIEQAQGTCLLQGTQPAPDQHGRKRLLLHSPFQENAGVPATGFVGIWSPDQDLSIELLTDGHPMPSLTSGSNWLLAAPPPENNHSFYVHKDKTTGLGIAFRGYISSPLLDHSSPSNRLFDYWRDGFEQKQNGVFALAHIDNQRRSLQLRTDAFGLAPLYYRIEKHFVLFGTNPEYLSMPDDPMDEVAALGLMSNGLITGNASLNARVSRTPIGTDVSFTGSTRPRYRRWFDFDDLPAAEEPLTDKHLKDLEEILAASVSRCIKMGGGDVFLPLSSGHDSRRLLALLLESNTPINTGTVRIFQQGNRDLDATFAAYLAEMNALDHQIYNLPDPGGFARDDARRRTLLGTETHMHTWALSMMRNRRGKPGVLLDGGIGDILGNPGIRLPGLYHDRQSDTDRLIAFYAPRVLEKYVSKEFFRIEALEHAILAYMEPFAHRRNITEFGALLQRQRRAVLIGPQQLAPPSTVVALPHADMDYIRAAIRIRPEDRHASPLQGACLKRFHPRLASVPGNREVPRHAKPKGERVNRLHRIACINYMFQEYPKAQRQQAMNGYLSAWGQTVMQGTRLCRGRNQRWAWFVQPALEVLLHGLRRRPVWQWAPRDKRN